jgi:septum site-determining protein MinD
MQLDKLSQFFQYIVVDIGSHLHDLQWSAIERASLILTLTTPEIISVTQTTKIIGDLMGAALPGDIIQLVVNKSNPAGLNPTAIGQTIRKNIIALLPQEDSTVLGSITSNQLFTVSNPRAPISQAYYDLVRRITSAGMLQKLKSMGSSGSLKKPTLNLDSSTGSNVSKESLKTDPRTILKMRIHSSLISAMDLKKGITDTNGDDAKEKALRSKTQQVISQIVDREAAASPREERAQLIKEVLDEALGLGPLEDLLADEAVTEIMVNGPHKIFIERKGRIELSPVVFTSNQHLRNVIERIVTPLGRRIDEKSPYVDARLKDGSRVNAVIEPIALDGAAVTIRKFAKKPVTAENYIAWNSVTQPMLDLLKICVENGLNIVISGGTGSGKTTLLNTMSGFIPANERIITVEDAAELQLKQEHVVRLETRPPNMEGTGAISIRDLVRNALRMRPDRIVVGECRGGEALDMLQAMNTGHDGSMTTTHANSPREAIARLETLCLMAGMDLPVRSIREQIAGAVHLIIQISRLPDGSRKIMSITEVQGMQGDVVTLQEIFKFKETGFDRKTGKILGTFQVGGAVPKFIEVFERKGIKIPRSIFQATPTPETSAANTTSVPPKKVGG